MSENEYRDWEQNEPEELKMALQNIRHNPIPDESFSRAINAAEKIAMTPQAWKRGFINMLLVAVPMYIVLGLVAYLISTKFEVSGVITTMIVFLTTCAICLLWGQIARVSQGSRVGAVLIDCGLCPGRAVFLLQAAIMVGMAIYFLLHGLTLISVSIALAFGLMAFFFVYLANSRLQFCEGGIRMHLNLLPWSKVAGYEWKEGMNPTLLIQTSSRLKRYGRGAFPIPAKYRDEVDALLHERIGRVNGNSDSSEPDSDSTEKNAD